MPVAFRVSRDLVRPMPKTYVSAISMRLSRGRSTPARRAINGFPVFQPGLCRVPIPLRAPAWRQGLATGVSQNWGRPRGRNELVLCDLQSALALLVARVLTNDHDPAVPADNPAL